MTNGIALSLLMVALALLLADHFLLQLNVPLLAARAVDCTIEYLSFWR